MSVGADVGGTFTDLVRWDGSRLTTGKTSTTLDQSDGVVGGAAPLLGEARAPVLVHGTTVATNTLLEGSGARVVLVTDAGFEDLVEIGRQNRPSLYDVFADRPDPLVPRELRVGVDGPGDPGLVSRVEMLEPEAVAVALLGAFADPAPESEIGRLLSGFDVSVSSGVVAEFREFERAATTILNAYLRPRTGGYLRRLEERVVPALADRLAVMRSSGGIADTEEAVRLPAALLLSGPAGGVTAAAALAAALGRERVVSFDMGGTSTDVCRIDGGRPAVSYRREVAGRPLLLPAVAIHTVGAGGGSIGSVDPGGALRVGPRSAGAHPGPACYRRGGTEPTVTDAHVVLGRLGDVLAGSVPLDRAAAVAALRRLGEAAGLGPHEAALGMIEVVEATMEKAVRAVSIEEGVDPGSAVLVAFGGAGGLHATSLARRLGMAGVVIAPHAGVFSALGLLLAPPRRDASRTVLLTDGSRLDASVAEVAAAAAAALPGARIETVVDVRYVGQSHETVVPYEVGEGWETLGERFHAAHAERNGFSRPGDPVEVVTVRAAAVGAPPLRWGDLAEHVPDGPDSVGEREVLVPGGPVAAVVRRRRGMRPGEEVVGPSVVEDDDSTTWIGPGERGRLHPSGALEVEW